MFLESRCVKSCAHESRGWNPDTRPRETSESTVMKLFSEYLEITVINMGGISNKTHRGCGKRFRQSGRKYNGGVKGVKTSCIILNIILKKKV